MSIIYKSFHICSLIILLSFSKIVSSNLQLKNILDLYNDFKNLANSNNNKLATMKFNELLEAKDENINQILFQDIYEILTEEEIDEYRKASNKERWIRQFWAKNDPTPATPENERLIEHYKRLEFAKKYFSSPQPRGYDDRGVIYVRYGEPDDKFVAPNNQTLRGNESWVYHRYNDVSFDFVEVGGTYKLLTDIKQVFAVPTRSQITKLELLWKFFHDRQNLSLKYGVTANLLNEIYQKVEMIRYGGGAASPEEIGYKLQLVDKIVSDEYLMKNEQVKNNLPSRLSNFHINQEKFKFIVNIASFYKNALDSALAIETSDSIRFEIYYAIPLKPLYKPFIFKMKENPLLYLNFAIIDKNENFLIQSTQNIELYRPAIISGADYLGQLSFFLTPDTYRVALDIQSPQTNQRGMMDMWVVVPEFPQDRLSMSDIELASIVRPASPEDQERGFIKNGLYVRPYPYRIIVRQQPIFVYFEIYGLFLDESSTARYRVTYEVEQKGPSGVLALLSALNPFGGKKSSLSLSYEYTTSDRHVQQYTSLDFSGLQPGEHTLMVRVEDLVAGVEVEKKVKFKLVQ